MTEATILRDLPGLRKFARLEEHSEQERIRISQAVEQSRRRRQVSASIHRIEVVRVTFPAKTTEHAIQQHVLAELPKLTSFDNTSNNRYRRPIMRRSHESPE